MSTNPNVHHTDVNKIAVPRRIVNDVRSLLQDYTETNELYDGKENSDEKIARYIIDVLEDFNSTPPIFRFRLVPIQLETAQWSIIRPLITTGTAARVLRSVMTKLARNDVPYTAGNVNMQPNAVWQSLARVYDDYKQEYEAKKAATKVAMNVSMLYGGGPYGVALTEYYDGIETDSIYVVI